MLCDMMAMLIWQCGSYQPPDNTHFRDGDSVDSLGGEIGSTKLQGTDGACNSVSHSFSPKRMGAQMLLSSKQAKVSAGVKHTELQSHLLLEFIGLLLGPGCLSLELPLLTLLALGLLLCTPETPHTCLLPLELG